MYLLGILCLVAATAALPVLPDPSTLTNSEAAAHQGSKIQIYNQQAATASASLQDIKDNDEVKKGVFKIGTVIFPPPPQLQLYDYSILRKQKVVQKQKYEDTVKQKCEDAKKEIVFVISGKPVKVEVPPNPAILTGFVTSLKDSEDRANIIHVGTDSAPVADKKDDEVVKHKRTKIATVNMPSLSELSSFDYSILRQQKANYNLKSEYFAKQATKQPKEEKEPVILDLKDPVKVEVPANPTTLIDSITAAQDSELCSNIFIVATDSALIANNKDDKEVEPNMEKDSEVYALVTDKKDDEEVKPNMVKIASIVIPAPPELPVFDYSILEKQLADQKQKLEEALKQEAEKSKKVKEVVILDQENPVKVSVRPNPATFTGFVPVLKNSEGRVNIIHVGTGSAPVADENSDGKVEHSLAKIATIVMPSPPELPPLDYSILRQQKADYNLKSEYSSMQAAKHSIKEKEALIVDLEEPVKIEVPANPTTLIDSVTTAQDSEVSALVTDKKDDEEVKPNMVKIASIVIPAPPELPVFDYSILEKQLADQKQKLEEGLKQEAEKSKKVKEVVILDQEEMPANEATLIDSVKAPQNSPIRPNILNITTDSAPVADNKDDEKLKLNMVKIATVIIPPSPELPPFDYSILKQQKIDYGLRSEYYAKQAAEKSKEVKEAVILDLDKPVKINVRPNSETLTDFVTALQDSEVRANILNIATDSAQITEKKDDEEGKHNIVKIATVIIPSPPELPPFDYSILKNHKVDQKQKSDHFLKLEAEKSKKEKNVIIIEEPVEVKEPKLIEDSKPIEESKPVEESKLIEVLKKEPVKHLEDIPVIIQWTITSAPLLSKLISNYPKLGNDQVLV